MRTQLNCPERLADAMSDLFFFLKGNYEEVTDGSETRGSRLLVRLVEAATGI